MTKYTKTFADALKEVREPKVVKEDYEVSMAIGQLKTIQDRIGKIMEFLSGKSDDYNMEAWLQSKITSAEDKLNSVANYVTNNPEVNEAKEEPKEKDNSEALEKTIADLKAQLALSKQKIENEKNKVVKPEANPETGEVPLRTGIANAILDKKMNTKDLVQSKKKKEIPVGGKTKIESNPNKDIGNFSGGMKVNSGNLHQGRSLVRDYKEFYREAKGDLPRIYCDMDGVLCDFIVQAKKATGVIFTQDKAKEHWDVIKKYPKFWTNMPWMPGGKQLWNYIDKYKPHILSAYTPEDPNCIPGKRTWLRRNVSISTSNINLVRRRDKQKFAMKSGGSRRPALLIDDFKRNVDQFKAAGGVGIHHTSASKTISELKRLGF